MLVTAARDYFRTSYSWKVSQCDITFNATPVSSSMDNFFVALDVVGAEGGSPMTDSLKESFTLVIGIWRRMLHYQKDRKGLMATPSDIYLDTAVELAELEQKVKVQRTDPALYGLHNNYTFLKYLNEQYNLPSETLGDKFTTPLSYLGSGPFETAGTNSGSSDIPWTGIKLRFKGCMKEQKLRTTTSARG